MGDELDSLIDRDADYRPASCLLIREHYRSMGCFDWNRERFLRLCAAWNETPGEMAERIGMTLSKLKRLMETPGFTFNNTEGILLQQHERFIEFVRTGFDRPGELFPPAKL